MLLFRQLKGWWAPFAVGMMAALFIMSSYPMMRPGFDIWWHLGVISNPSALDEQAYSAPRIFWHWAWHGVLELLSVSDPFVRALLIHRFQFLLTFFLIAFSSYLILAAASLGKAFEKSRLWLAALLSSAIWFLMHGTHSVAHDGGPGAAFTQSWIVWYSVNYQISLPLIVTALALTLTALNPTISLRLRLLVGSGIVTFLVGAFLTHMAELVYYLVLTPFLVLFVRRPRHALLLFSFCVAGILFSLAALHFSYRTPLFISEAASSGGFGDFVTSMMAEGHSLRERNATRMSTGWTSLHLISVLAILTLLVLELRKFNAGLVEQYRIQVILFVFFSASLPALLFTDLGTGLFAFLTHSSIAYRFSFGSLLFVALPLLMLNCPFGLPVSGRKKAAVCLSVAFSLVASVVILDAFLWRRQPVLSFAASIATSLDPEKSFYHPDADRIRKARRVVLQLEKEDSTELVCQDIFTNYYMFFILHYRYVALPPALRDLPGYQKPDVPCDFKKFANQGVD